MRQQIPDGLVASAHSALSVNRRHGLTVPHLHMFPGGYLWDIAVIAKGISVYDPRRAADELLRFLESQWASGMLPNETYFEQRTLRRLIFGDHPDRPVGHTTSGITQPPMIVRSALEVGRTLPADDRQPFYAAVFPQLRALCGWVLRERVGRRGLAVVIHPYETGMDNRIDLAEAMAREWLVTQTRADEAVLRSKLWAVGRTRQVIGDCRVVPVGHRSSNDDVLAAYRQTRHIRRLDYHLGAVEASSQGLLVEDVGYNAVLVDAFACLEEMAGDMAPGTGQLDPQMVEAMHEVADRLEDLWFDDPTGGASGYYSRDHRTGEPLARPTVAGLFPLLTSRVKDRVEQMVATLVTPSRYWGPVPVPSAPMDSPGFSPEQYWRGPAWPFPTDLVETGLERAGYPDVAAELRQTYLRRPHSALHTEYQNPVTGEALGARPFSPSAALTIRFNHKEST